jgi:hypothetical protein
MTYKTANIQVMSGKTLLLVTVGCGLLCIIYVWSQAPMTYLGFLRHNKSYFIKMAEECERLRSQFNSGMPDRRFQGHDPSLPVIIRRLNADYVDAGVTGVVIVVNSGRPEWGVYWMQSPDKSWDLSAYGEDLRTPVFSTNLPLK